jgi:hypothetical protein
MNSKVRRHINRGINAVSFTAARVAPSPDAVSTSDTQIQALVTQGRQLIAAQDQAHQDVRAATARKYELRRMLRQAHLVHIAETAKLASAEVPGLDKAIRMPGAMPYVQFASVTRGMLEKVNENMEVLTKHGLDKSVVDGVALALDQFDAAVKQGVEARQARAVATKHLATVAAQISAIVRQLDGTYRTRFLDQPELLAGWRSAIRLGAPHPKHPESSDASTPPAQSPAPATSGGEIKPAA